MLRSQFVLPWSPVEFLDGSVAEWSKAQVLGTCLSGGVGSNPTAATTFLIFAGVTKWEH